MSSYETRQRALELAMRAYEGKAVPVNAVTKTARAFEAYLLSGESPPAEPAQFAEPLKVGSFKDALARGGVASGVTTFSRLSQADAINRLDDDSVSIVRRALTEALQLGHNKIGPEHILLAIIRDGSSVAAAALIDLAGTGNDARKAVIKRISDSHQP